MKRVKKKKSWVEFKTCGEACDICNKIYFDREERLRVEREMNGLA